jgi:hypothetical protein
MLFFIGFGILVIVLIAIITAIAQPPNRWVERYVERSKGQFPAKKAAEPKEE